MVALYNEMMDAMLEIEARTFLTASEHLENLRTRANKQAFDSFLRDQGSDRKVLLRRITSGAG